MNYLKQAIAFHKRLKGKLEIKSKAPLATRRDLSLAYTPGVAAVSLLVAKNKKEIFNHTIKANTVAVVSDGSAVLGLGNIGPQGALPVMEGKAILFKEFGGVDAFPICLATQETDKIVETVKLISPVFGGINLEDISAPRCFEIEARLKKELDIPVFHDDQHGTAIVVLAGLINALKIVKKNISDVKVVVNGAGAAGNAIVKIFMKSGVLGKNIIMLDSRGALYRGREGMNIFKQEIAAKTNPQKISGGLGDVLSGADVFIGVSTANILKPEMIEAMTEKPIVFAMANPHPEISFEAAKKTKIAVFGTGRSDYPNQINNVLAFPGVFRGALDIGAKQITEKMKLAAAKAIASAVSKSDLAKRIIVPSIFNRRVAKMVAEAVKKAARQ